MSETDEPGDAEAHRWFTTGGLMRTPRTELSHTEIRELSAPMRPVPKGDADADIAAVARQRRAMATPRASRRWPPALALVCACGAGLCTMPGCTCGAGMCPKCGADACQCPAAESRPPALAEQSRAMPTDSSGPDGIIVGEYSGVMQAAFLRRGIRMITVDYGPSRVPGAWHYLGTLRGATF